ATIETDHTSKQGLYDVIQSFKDKVRTEGKSFYRLNVRINSEDIIAPQDLIQLKEMITEFEENENQFVFIEDLNLQYVQNDEMPIVKEFSP
ncbi:DNA repair exonuclease, partial [Xylophilus sp. Kf1]|nr:DNA repair exonuclease [Xylophilus sp. Kf1]